MCCFTHRDRDRQAQAANILFVLADDEDTRCKCQFGEPCYRRMTQEDMMCDWCRGRDHYMACDEIYEGRGGNIGEPAPMFTSVLTEEQAIAVRRDLRARRDLNARLFAEGKW